jgi:hypothetical protein
MTAKTILRKSYSRTKIDYIDWQLIGVMNG